MQILRERPASVVPSRGATVLIADDEPEILDLLARIVSHHGHRVVRAERGDTALALIRQEKPDLIFLDVLMPGIDGLAVCAAVRADAELARVPVVLLSAMGNERLAKVAEQVDASASLCKPMRLEVVEKILARFLVLP